jgi:hypothetical protein
MGGISVSEVERRSGVEKHSGETLAEYLSRVGDRTDLPPETVSAVVDHVNRDRFGPATPGSDTPDAPIEEFLRAVDSLDRTDEEGTVSEQEVSAGSAEPEEPSPPGRASTAGPLGEPSKDDRTVVPRVALLLVVVVLLGGVVAGGAVLMNGDVLSTPEEGPADEETPVDGTPDGFDADDAEETDDDAEPIDIGSDDASESDIVDSAEDADGALAVTELLVDGDDPDEEFVELTNTGDVALEMSDWTVHDREGDGVVDDRGLDPVTFPDGFVLEPDESVRIVTALGEDTEDAVHWGYADRQNWRADGDVIRVLDGDGETVLSHEYGTLPE